MQRILNAELDTQLNRGRQLLGDIREGLIRFGADRSDEARLAASIRQLDEFFLLVVVGEFNAGKSAFINALIGHDVVPEGVTPTTSQIHVLKHGDAVTTDVDADGVRVLCAPVELLREVHIVDTPGTNAIIREHERLTTEFMPRADLVFFVTSADRPFTETERAFLEAIRSWGKKTVIIINKADIFERQQDVDEVMAFIREASQRLLAFEPEIFPVSARLALRAKQGHPSFWAKSGFEELERYIAATLEEGSRFRLKLANPLGVAEALAERYARIAGERLTLVDEDLRLLDHIERQLEVYRSDLARGFELRMTAVEKVLADLEARGHAYFEDTLRLGRVFDLLNRARVQKEFADRVIAEAPRQIERRVAELIDWLVEQDFRQWQIVTSSLVDRTRSHGTRVLGAPDIGTFHTDRARLIDGVGGEAQRVVDTYDKEREAAMMADQARAAVTTAAAAGGAALGLGTLVTLAASTAAADVTGIVMASFIAALGFLVIPARRRKAKLELQQKVSTLRVRLADTLRAEFERAQDQSRSRLDQALAPYSGFVRAEHKRWNEAQTAFSALRSQAQSFLQRLAA